MSLAILPTRHLARHELGCNDFVLFLLGEGVPLADIELLGRFRIAGMTVHALVRHGECGRGCVGAQAGAYRLGAGGP